ncbi:MAG: hypothetical protein GWN73_43895, partial [Actinobacteria bacterium]|nr:hypothetical protein [Actinomycetota bacterium]NIU71947.1 hypothetical protein [Actinomycetota bacterium]
MTSWVRTFGFIGADQGYDVAVGNDGTVYLTGTFQGNVSFGGPSVSGMGGSVDAFLAAFTPDGEATWAIDLGGDGNDRAQGVAVDGMGRVY